MFREVHRPERNEVDRITSAPWRSRWRGLRFGHPRVEGSLSGESEQLVLVVAPIVAGAGAVIAWTAENRSCSYWVVGTLVLRRRYRGGDMAPARRGV